MLLRIGTKAPHLLVMLWNGRAIIFIILFRVGLIEYEPKDTDGVGCDAAPLRRPRSQVGEGGRSGDEPMAFLVK